MGTPGITSDQSTRFSQIVTLMGEYLGDFDKHELL